jgi:hypothetical protein
MPPLSISEGELRSLVEITVDSIQAASAAIRPAQLAQAA